MASLITPLYAVEQDDRIIDRIIRRSENGDVETVFMRDGDSYWVVLRDRDTVHASLPVEEHLQQHCICWTKFQDMEQPVLCILVNATQLKLWDSTSFLCGGEGTTVHLPCQATSIFPFHSGILIQRRLAPEDQDDNEDEDMLFLGTKTTTPAEPVASVFSLTHPLQTILPLANTNVLEQLVFVGILNDSTSVCLTYHVELQRHALWVMEKAPATPSPPPIVIQQPSTDATSFLVEQDLLREDASFYEGTTLNQALADALGVGHRPTDTAIPLYHYTAPLHPEFRLQRLYEAVASARAETIFLAGSCLCLCVGQELFLWQIQTNRQVTPVATIACLSAVPIQSLSRQDADILVIADNGLCLYRQGTLLTQVAPHSSKDSMTELSHAVETRYTIRFASGRVLRAELNLELDFVSERVLAAVEANAGVELAIYLRLDSMRLLIESQDTAWTALSRVLRQALGVKVEEKPAAINSAWDVLISGQYHAEHGNDFNCFQEVRIATQPVPLGETTLQSTTYLSKVPDRRVVQRQIFDAIHLLYEDLKLSVVNQEWTQPIRAFLMSCLNNTMEDYLNHYNRDGRLLKTLPSQNPPVRMSSFRTPPCVMSWIARSLLYRDCTMSWLETPVVAQVCHRTKLVCRAFSKLVCGLDTSDNKRDVMVLEELVETGDSSFLLDDLPIGVALPLLDVLERCCDSSSIAEGNTLSKETWTFLGRADIATQMTCTGTFEENDKGPQVPDTDNDGLLSIESSHALRFPNDNRLREVGRLLRSSRPVFVKVPRAVEVSDHDYERLKQERLLTLSRRVLALPLGRGMFTLGTLRPVPAEQLPMPKLCLSGRVPPTNTSLALDMSNTPSDMLVWPEFHNGVAAGLRLPRASESFKVSRSWIVYNKGTTNDLSEPDAANQATNEHGGLLMALGLRGHLSTLSMTDIYEYLTQGSVTTSVGVLIGMSCAKRGTCDMSISKMLCLHIPSLLPPSFSSIDVSSAANAAAVAGLGILYQGSSHRLMTEFLLNEMGRRPVSDSFTVDREAYTLSCGLALGMINLAKGGSDSNAGLADLELEQRLYRYVVGGLDDRANRRRQDLADRRVQASVGGMESERCSRVYEGDTINNDITAPGALLALGLIFMKSGNKVIASNLALPDTHFLLEYARPDTLMLRVMARSLIMWDEVDPSITWAREQVPPVVRRAYHKMQRSAKKTAELIGITGHRRDESGSVDGNPGEEDTDTDFHADHAIDRQTVRQINAYVLAGACFSIGLRFSGTVDPRAAETISKVLLEMKYFRDINEHMSMALRPEPSIVNMCLGLCAISLALVMAGTGDLETLRLLKMIRWRSDGDINHGSHMAINSAIGLLFLGGGMCTVGRSADDIAALVCAFFPRYPTNSSDNRYHLQAMRHLYALAVHQRRVDAVDVDSKEVVSVIVEACLQDNYLQPLQFRTPSLLNNTESEVCRLIVQSDHYFPATLLIDENMSDEGFRIFVKKRQYHGHKGIKVASADGKGSSAAGEEGLFYATSSRGSFQCQSDEKLICSNSLGSLSSPVPQETILAMGLQGSMNATFLLPLAWDVLLIQAYFIVTREKPHSRKLIDHDKAALVIERAKHLLKRKGKMEKSFPGLNGKEYRNSGTQMDIS